MTCCTRYTAKTRGDYRREARVCRALANEARLMMVDRLREGDLSVGALAKAVDQDISTVSRHLSVLRQAGIVGFQKDGKNVRYRLLTPCVLDIFACLAQVLECCEPHDGPGENLDHPR